MSATKSSPAQPGKPASLFSLRARKRQATGEPFVFDVDGEIFTMRPPSDVDWQVVADLGSGQGNLREFLKQLLGDDYDRFCKLEGISSDDVNELINAATQHYQGITRGE